jgi:hypothetical protein
VQSDLEDKLKELNKQAKLSLEKVRIAQESLKPTKDEKARIEAFQNLDNLALHMNVLASMEARLIPLKIQTSSMFLIVQTRSLVYCGLVISKVTFG